MTIMTSPPKIIKKRLLYPCGYSGIYGAHSSDIRDDSPGGACCTFADFDFVKKEIPFFWKYLRQILRLDSVKPS
jgi:hypothetical protein